MTTLDLTDKDKSILMFLIENDNKPTHATGIAKKSGNVSKAWSQERCHILGKKSVLSHVMIKPARQKNKTEHYFIASTIAALDVLLDAFKSDHDAQNALTQFQPYRSLIPEIVREFKSLMPSYIDERVFHSFSTQYEEKMPIYAEKDDPMFYNMWLCRRSPLAEGESLKHALTAFKIDFTEEDENCLAESLKHNWLTLKYVMLCISITDEERERMILQIWFAVNDSRLSPSAARKDGWLTALDSVGPLISKKAEYVAAYDRFYDAVRSEPSINWIEFFCQLDHFNSTYRFLM